VLNPQSTVSTATITNCSQPNTITNSSMSPRRNGILDAIWVEPYQPRIVMHCARPLLTSTKLLRNGNKHDCIFKYPIKSLTTGYPAIPLHCSLTYSLNFPKSAACGHATESLFFAVSANPSLLHKQAESIGNCECDIG